MITRISKIWVPVYDDATPTDPPAPGAGGGGGQDPATPPATPPAKDGEPMLSQSKVNEILAKERRKHNAAREQLIKELSGLKDQQNITDGQRQELEDRIEQLQNESLTKEQLAKKNADVAEKKYKRDLDGLTVDRDEWKKRYTEATISRSIMDAAITNEAFSPEQIVAILRPNTQLLEALDDDGQPTGNLVPKVKFRDKDKDGNPVELTLTVAEAVKRMKELTDQYGNLFKSTKAGGVGGSTVEGGKAPDMAAILKDPAAFREARKQPGFAEKMTRRK